VVVGRGAPRPQPELLGGDRQRRGSPAPNARKVRNIDENAQVAVTIDDTIECVSVEGHARRAGAGEAEAMVAAYLDKYFPDPETHDEARTFILDHAVVAVVPERAFGIIEREDEFATRATRWVWSTSAAIATGRSIGT
jgi:hypothetical protein